MLLWDVLVLVIPAAILGIGWALWRLDRTLRRALRLLDWLTNPAEHGYHPSDAYERDLERILYAEQLSRRDPTNQTNDTDP